MTPTSSTSMIRLEDRETIVGVPRQTSSAVVTRRSRTVVHISDEQIAKMTELLQEVVRLTEQIVEHWVRVVELWDEIVTSDVAKIGKGNIDSIAAEKCRETRCLSQMPCFDTHVIKNKSRWEVR